MHSLASTFAITIDTDPVLSVARSELRWQIVIVAVAVLLLTIALGAFGLFFARRKSHELTLLYFGTFCGLYGARMLAAATLVQAEFDFSGAFWLHVRWCITAIIVVPLALFLYQVVPPEMQRVLRVLIAVQAVAGVAGIVASFFHVDWNLLFNSNSVILLGLFAVLGFCYVWRRLTESPSDRKATPRDVRILLGGFLVWFAFIVYANVQGMLVPFARSYEFIGLLVFVATLGYVTAYRTFATEDRLAALNTELGIARQIQNSTLPQAVPKLVGLEIAARYVPMSAVAGDFYDFILVDDRRLGVLVADVTGHGVPAALIAAMLKVSFAAQQNHAADPARLLDEMNRALCGKFDEYFVTAAYVYVDLENRTVEYAGAAHPALIHVPAASEERAIEQNGLMLGSFPEAQYSSTAIPVAKGDRIVLCTDGLLEARTVAGEEFGTHRYADFLKAQRGCDPGSTADALVASVMKFAGYDATRTQDDDITLLVLDFS